MSFIEDMGDFRGENFAENHYVVTVKNVDPLARYVTLTGGDDTKALIVPFAHRIVKVILRQTDNANADATNALDIIVRRDAGQISILPLGKDLLISEEDLIDTVNLLTFGDGFEYEPTKWTLVLTGAATNRVHLLIYLQRLGGRH